MKIKEYSQMMHYLTRPKSMAQEPRNMYAGGQLVQNTVDGSRPGYDGATKLFTLKKEKIPGTKSSKVVDIVANTPEAKIQLNNFIEEYKLSKEYAKTSTAADQAGVKRTRALYDKYFKNHYSWKTYNQNILGAIKKKYNISDNPIISDDPEKLKRYNADVDERIARKLQKRYEQDPFKLKQKARKIAGRAGDMQVAFHHGLGLDSIETLNSLIADEGFAGSKGVTGHSTVEKALRDFEKQIDNLKLNEPDGWKRKSEKLMAKLNRLKNGKEVNYQYTTPKGKIKNTTVKFTKDQLGMYGFKADTSTGYKGLDKSKTVAFQAGVSEELANKPLNKLNAKEQQKAIEALVKVLGGKEKLNQLLFKGGGTTAEKSLVQKIISGGGKMALGMLNPAELIKLKNLIGPGALGIMAAFEAGVVTDDVLRMGKPLNESLAANWLFKSFRPHSEEFEKQRNLLQSGKLNDSQRQYALEMMKIEQATKEFNRLEMMESTQLVDGAFDDNFTITSQEEINTAKQKLVERVGRIKESAFEEGTAKQLENKAAMVEKEATEMAKKKFSPLFGDSGTPLVNMAPRPENMGRGPMTEKKRMNLDFSIPGYTPYNKAYTLSDKEISDFYQTLEKPRALNPGEGTLIRMGIGGEGLYGTQDKFAEGGLAGLMKKYYD